MRQSFPFLFCVWALLLTHGRMVAQEQDTLSYRLPQPVTITAQRYEIEALNSPQALSIFDLSDLLENNPRSTPEAMIGVPGIWMQKTNHGGGSPFIRGLTGNQTLLLVDGIRLNNSTYRYGPNQYLNTVDPLSLNRIEVVRGSGSVQYGSDALGGAAQLITQSPDFSGAGFQAKGRLYGKYMSQDMEWTGRAVVELQGEKVALLGGLSLKDFGDLVAGGDLGTQAPSAYQERDMDLKARIKVTDRNLLTAAYQFVRQENVGRFDQVAQRGYKTYQFDPQERTLGYLRWEHVARANWVESIRMILSYQQSVEGRTKQRENEDFITQEEDIIDTWGFTVEMVNPLPANGKLISGVEAYRDEVASQIFTTDVTGGLLATQRGLYPNDSKALNLAAFSLSRWELPSWIFEAGLRYNQINLDIPDETFGEIDIQPSAVVGNISAMYKLAPSDRVYTSLNSGFRAPNINDLSSFGSFDSGIEVPTSTLDPERSLTAEAGYKHVSRSVTLNTAVFYNRLFDLITRIPANFNGSSTFNGEDVYKKANTAKAYIWGIEADLLWQFAPRWEGYGTFSYAYGQDVSKDEPMRRIPPLNGLAGLRYTHPSGFWSKADLLFADKQDRLSGGDQSDHRIAAGGTPGWQVMNLTAGYTWNRFDFNLGLQNLWDEAYRMHGSGVDGYGRSLWAVLQIRI